MPSNTYVLLASSTVGSGGASSIDFTSIPATYTDLVVKLSVRNVTAQIYGGAYIFFNGSTANRSTKAIESNGASVSSFGSSYMIATSGNGASSTASTFASAEIYIPNYAGSTNKSFSADGAGENNATTAYLDLVANLWSDTSAINRITISQSSTSLTGDNFVQYSTAYLFGIKSS